MGPPWILPLALQALAPPAASLMARAPGFPEDGEARRLALDKAPQPDLGALKPTFGVDHPKASFEMDYVHPPLWPGAGRFAELLTRDLDPLLAEALAKCPTVVQGGCQDADVPGRRCTDAFPKESVPGGRVWIIVQPENTNGPSSWGHVRAALPPGDKVVFLGPWWNETHANYSSNGIRSIWVPYASTSFAQHVKWTPMDLFVRPKARFEVARPYTVAYQQTHCTERREKYWDLLNGAMMASLNGTRGHNLSKCNGNDGLGEPLQLPTLSETSLLTSIDLSVDRFEKFRFVMSAENSDAKRPPVGYITEKIANAYLAGAVPIYWGVSFEKHGAASFEQLEQIFLPGTYIRGAPDNEELRDRSIHEIIGAARNSSEYRALVRPGSPVVSEEGMRRFFTWHPSTWRRFGDGLRQDILRAVLELCHDPTPAGP